jgi:hypothetical protein
MFNSFSSIIRKNNFSIALLAISAVLSNLGCNRVQNNVVDKAPIDSLMHLQQEAWNRGDIDGFMQWYWKSDSLCFISPNGITRGWNQTLARYKKSYPDQSTMGNLLFKNESTNWLSDSAAFTVGKWTLFRTRDTLSGHYSLLWKQLHGNWVIVVDHTD